MEEKLIGVLGYILNKSHDEIKTTFLNEGGQLIENLEQKAKAIHDENLDAQTSARKEIFDNGYKKAQREVLEKKESELRQKFDVSGVSIDDIVQEIYDNGKKEAKLNPSDVKNSEVYLNDIKKFQDKIQEVETTLEKERSNWEREKVNSVAYQSIPSVLKEAKKVIPDGADERECIDLIMLNLERKGITIALNDKGKPMPVDGEGNRLRNERTLKDMTFQEVIEQNAFFLPTAQNSGGQSPGNANQGGGSGKNYDFSSVKTGDDYLETLDKLLESKDDDRDDQIQALQEHGTALGL